MVVNDPAQHVEIAALAVEPDGFIQIGDGFVKILLGVVSGRPHEIAVGLVRFDLGGRIQLGDGRIEIADRGEGHGADAMGRVEALVVGRARGDEGSASVEHLLDGASAGEAGIGLFRPRLRGESGKDKR